MLSLARIEAGQQTYDVMDDAARWDIKIHEHGLIALVDAHFDAARPDPHRARFMFAAHFGPRAEMPATKDPDHEDAARVTERLPQLREWLAEKQESEADDSTP